MNSIYFNGKIVAAEAPVLRASNRSYRYGDGLFETMKLSDGKLVQAAYHFERMFESLHVLHFEIPRLFLREKLEQQIQLLCKKNNCEKLARVRLSVFRGNGGLYDEGKTLEYIIESWPLAPSVNKLNENGLVIGIYPNAQKSCDQFSNLKSANFLPYSMAALFAKENKWNDSLVLNAKNRIADTTIANIFIIKENTISTPALAEGCVKGVMRRYLLEKLRLAGFTMQETGLTEEDLQTADEVFLTNAINGIRWVKQYKDKIYTNIKTAAIYDRFIKTIFA